jgi:hypothetical protein
MKFIAIYFLILFPFFAFAQLFPKIGEFRGNIERVVERRYGKDGQNPDFRKAKMKPAVFSGWKYTYWFDENSQLVKRINTFQSDIIAEYLYQRDTSENKWIEREIITSTGNEQSGDYIEHENFRNSAGQIVKVNYWAFSAKDDTRSLYLIEQDAQYKNKQLSSFTRTLIDESGNVSGNEKCNLYYDKSGKLVRIERVDQDSGFRTLISNEIEGSRMVSHYSVDLMSEVQEFGKNQIQDIYYKFDNKGNWTRMYWKSGNKTYLEAKRKITYR